jgi:hypothetical protein
MSLPRKVFSPRVLRAKGWLDRLSASTCGQYAYGGEIDAFLAPDSRGLPTLGTLLNTRPPLRALRGHSAKPRIDPSLTTVGLPDSAVRESRERVRTAIRNAGYAFPSDRITVNLAPADLRKEGASFDLPIALGILTATGCVRRERSGAFAVVGELALDGQIQPVRGALAVGLTCRRKGVGTLLVPCDNVAEATAVEGVRVIGAGTLRDAVALLNGETSPAAPTIAPVPAAPVDELDLADVRGQAHAKRALEIAAAGAHNVLLLCPITSWPRRPAPREDAVDLNRVLLEHDLVDERPQQPLAALRI